jgi:hypothetical protein
MLCAVAAPAGVALLLLLLLLLGLRTDLLMSHGRRKHP